jgi:hypothetical protein
MQNNDQFSFNISLSVLNHLGRNLYRSFVTVLGEAISNAWDADADNVRIYIDKDNFVIKDDGLGMSSDDFRDKFLNIGYSKRKDGDTKSGKGRPYIGRKGIGKLALLSCASKISIISRTKGQDYVGGVIDNSKLSQAITDNLTPQEYPLGIVDDSVFAKYKINHEHGTIIYFEGFNDGVRNSLDYLRKMIALYFRFSLLDKSFNIFLNDDDKEITQNDLQDLALKTEFLWEINDHTDAYKDKLTKIKESKRLDFNGSTVKGFIASVKTPRDLKVISTDERVSVDLFVNGRLREKDILKHIPSARVVESYLYGQIHFDELDGDETDRFTSSREGVVADDPKYRTFLENFKKNVIAKVLEDWDKWRIQNREDGDSENENISIKERKGMELGNAVVADYTPPKDFSNKTKFEAWIKELINNAKYNFPSYAECFISENLIRKHIKEKKIDLSKVNNTIKENRDAEIRSKNKGNISIDIRKNDDDIYYLSMNNLAYLVDSKSKENPKELANLIRDADEYKPMRDAIAHTSLLTDAAKNKLSSVYENLKARLRTLFFNKGEL